MVAVPSLQAWQDSGQLIPFKNWQIFTRIEGEGLPMLVLHGFPTASYDYAKIAPLLTHRYKLVMFDYLGYGFSDKPQKHPYSLFEDADIAEAVARHYGITQCMILTHDIGNSVTLELLKRGNLTVNKLVMLNGSVLLDHYRPVITQKLLLHPVIGPWMTRLRLIRRPVFAKQFGKLFAVPPTDEEIDAFWELIGYNDGMANYHLLIQYLNERLVHQHAWLDALKTHRAPLTLIWGQHDPVAVPKIAEAILERRPDTDYHPLADVGHFPHWEAPEVVAKIILED